MPQTPPPTLSAEEKLWSSGTQWVAGVDEVGRGALAGPVVAAAVVFAPSHQPVAGIRDSKQLSATKRTRLAAAIKEAALGWAIGQGAVTHINAAGIMPALTQAISSALQQLPRLEQVLMDGKPLPQLPHAVTQPITFLVKGDQISYSIAAASILAKVHRDQLMHQLGLESPEYGWDRNVGYGTAQHRAALVEHGVSPHHRTAFCAKTLKQLA